jgi:DNA ligase-4
MLVWNKDLGGFKEFGHNRTFALSDGSNTQENFCYMIFDVLHVNGKDIFAEPLRKRRKYLEKIIAVEPHVIEIVPQSPVISTSEIYEALDAAILNR